MVSRTAKFARLWAQAIFVGLLSVPARATSPLQVDRTNILFAQQDSAGVVWGVGVYGTPGLYRWEQKAWQRVTGEGTPAGGAPMALARGNDGAVYCVWHNPSDTQTLTRHQGNSSRQFARFTGAPWLAILAPASLWIPSATSGLPNGERTSTGSRPRGRPKARIRFAATSLFPRVAQ